MIRLVGAANRRNRAWTEVTQIGGRRVILERLMMGDVVKLCNFGQGRSVRPFASRAAVRIGSRQIETALKKASAYAFLIQEIADVDVFPAHRCAVTVCTGVARWLRIADNRPLNDILLRIDRWDPSVD